MEETIEPSPVSWEELFMKHAYLIATKSKDPRTKIGAVLVKKNIIISEGFNGFPRGVVDLTSRYIDRETKYRFVVHSELNAILNASRHGVNTEDSDCYTQAMPCCECAKALIQAGIKSVIIHEGWPDMDKKWNDSFDFSFKMFHESGVRVIKYCNKLKVLAYCNGEIKTV
jgi:dCMP deaminase